MCLHIFKQPCNLNLLRSFVSNVFFLARGLPCRDPGKTMSTLAARYKAVREATRSLAARVTAEDQMVQSCPEASTMKWHQAHTTWFFETFVLRPFLADYKPFREEFRWLFNSYYDSLG